MPVDTSLAPLAALPAASALSSKASFSGSGVCGIVYAGSFSLGKATNPACTTGAAMGAAAGTPAPALFAAGVDAFLAGPPDLVAALATAVCAAAEPGALAGAAP